MTLLQHLFLEAHEGLVTSEIKLISRDLGRLVIDWWTTD